MIVSLLKALSLFALVGPAVGLGAVIAQEPSIFGSVLPALLIFMSYLYGLVPALITGLFAWSFRNRLRRATGAISSGIVGAIAASVCLAAFVDSDSLVGAVAAPGGIAGVVCGLIYFKAR